MPISLTPDPLVPGMGRCTNIGLIASWLCPEREREAPYRFGTRASADGICDMQTVEQISQALGLEMEHVFLSHQRGQPGSHNFAHWAMSKMDRLHEYALIEDWARSMESDVDVKVWPEYTDDSGDEWDWKARVSSVMGSAEYTAIGVTPGHAITAALELAAGGMPITMRRTSVYFSDAKWASRHAFRLATDDLPQAVKEDIASKYVKDRDARLAADNARLQAEWYEDEASVTTGLVGRDDESIDTR